MSVFISHSHIDRNIAVDLQSILKDHNVETYLDQDKIFAGDHLPEKISQGINACEIFLLIWSRDAAQSNWVNKEWNEAYDRRKRILPYLIDDAKLPNGLDHLVYIDKSDRNLSNANLLTAILGSGFQSSPDTLFPGRWRAEQFNDDLQFGAWYQLNLRSNGQIKGIMGAELGSFMGGLLSQIPLTNTTFPVYGNWSYEAGTQILTLNITAKGMGQQQSSEVKIFATGKEKGVIHGQDLYSCRWSLQRAS